MSTRQPLIQWVPGLWGSGSVPRTWERTTFSSTRRLLVETSSGHLICEFLMIPLSGSRIYPPLLLQRTWPERTRYTAFQIERRPQVPPLPLYTLITNTVYPAESPVFLLEETSTEGEPIRMFPRSSHKLATGRGSSKFWPDGPRRSNSTYTPLTTTSTAIHREARLGQHHLCNLGFPRVPGFLCAVLWTQVQVTLSMNCSHG